VKEEQLILQNNLFVEYKITGTKASGFFLPFLLSLIFLLMKYFKSLLYPAFLLLFLIPFVGKGQQTNKSTSKTSNKASPKPVNKVVSTTLFKMNNNNLVPTKEYVVSDSSFYMEISMLHKDSVNIQVVWKFKSYGEDFLNQIDSSVFGINKVSKFTVSLMKKGVYWPAGEYQATIYLQGKKQKTHRFDVKAESVPAILVFSFSNPQKNPVNEVRAKDSALLFRVYLDKNVVKDSSKVEIKWFFEDTDKEVVFLNNQTFLLDFIQFPELNYVDFIYPNSSEWPKGYVVAEVWLNGVFKKFTRLKILYPDTQ